MERTEEKSPLDNTPKPLKRQGFSESCFQNGASFSSQPRYDHFDTAAYLSLLRYPIFAEMSRRQPRVVAAPLHLPRARPGWDAPAAFSLSGPLGQQILQQLHQLGDVDGLGDVAVHPRLQRRTAVLVEGVCRHGDDGDARDP